MTRLVLPLFVLGLLAGSAQAVDKRVINKAIENGVAALKKMQRANGTWNHPEIGATALAGVTLLECGVKSDDKAVQAAARVVRSQAMACTHTYSLALSIIFLDRLDERKDTPLIESMVVRLMAGQQVSGGWSYNVPATPAAEVKRLSAEMGGGARVLKGSRDLNKLPAKGKRDEKGLPKEIQAQLKVVNRPVAVAQLAAITSDNSNTQFATLALWVGRRYGIPVGNALKRVDTRFRMTQHADGGWGYMPSIAGVMTPGSTATMTCAGVLSLAIYHGHQANVALVRNPKAGAKDLKDDKAIKAGLLTLSTAVGSPVGAGRVPAATGKAYYFLWSLERVCVSMGLDTLGKKDWYGWGCEILIGNQGADGSWASGEYATYGADTCFALLFLKRSNLADDLTKSFKSLKDPFEKTLKAGGVGGGSLKGGKALPAVGIGGKPKTKEPAPDKKPKTPDKKPTTPAAKLGAELIKAKVEDRGEILRKLRDTKGTPYTEALATVIPKLDLLTKDKARTALAERLSRMKSTTLKFYFKDEDTEIRRAAALACTAKKDKSYIPDLIALLNDKESLVERAAHAALKDLSKEDFGPKAGASSAERKKAIAAWLAWWKKQK